jgi:hypothetical protein
VTIICRRTLALNLYSGAFTADAIYGTKINPEHEIILTAETPDEALLFANEWFTKNGAYTGSANPVTAQAGIRPPIRNPRITQLESLVVYQERLRSRQLCGQNIPKLQDFRQMTDEELSSYVDQMPSEEFELKCADPDFKKRVEKLKS